MPEPTVEQLLNNEQPQITNKPSAFVPLLIFCVFPPAGTYLLWKEKYFHKTFALLSLVLGISNTLTGLSIILTLPKFNFFLGQSNISTNSDLSLIYVYLFVSVVQIFVSYFLWRKAKLDNFLSTTNLAILVSLTVLVDFLLIPILMGGFVLKTLWPVFQQYYDPYQSIPL